MNKRLYKALCLIEDTIAFTMIVVGSCMAIGQSQTGNLKQELVINIIGIALFTLGMLDIKE